MFALAKFLTKFTFNEIPNYVLSLSMSPVPPQLSLMMHLRLTSKPTSSINSLIRGSTMARPSIFNMLTVIGGFPLPPTFPMSSIMLSSNADLCCSVYIELHVRELRLLCRSSSPSFVVNRVQHCLTGLCSSRIFFAASKSTHRLVVGQSSSLGLNSALYTILMQLRM